MDISAGGLKSFKNPAWINLEYLSAEAYAQRCHGLPSPVMQGPGTGMIKRFFYPGFTPPSGGLLREPDLCQRQDRFDRAAWLTAQGIQWSGERVVSLFCYEPAALAALLQQWATDPTPTQLLVTPGRAQAAVRAALAALANEASDPDETGAAPEPPVQRAQATGTCPPNGSNRAQNHSDCQSHGQLTVHELPYLSQPEFDHLLWASDINFVRGEDSLVRALWAGKPFIWHIYPQDDGAHWAKLNAFLNWLEAPADLRAVHQAWNLDTPPTPPHGQAFPALATVDWAASHACVQAARQRLLAQPDLVTQLQNMVVDMQGKA